MKVKVRRGPGLTGSQKNYGLVTGSIWNYEDKPTSNNVGTTLSPVPRDEATIEAERGETVIGDLDNDGMVEHAKIGGKRHSHGGTPLNVPDGSFVFSDYRGLLIKNTDVLKNIFGMNTNKAVTPAKVAQRYEINKFKNMLNDPFIDPIDRKTAQLMIDNNMRKLGQLALIQEGMKGFPDGIPAIAMPLMGSDMAQQGGQQKMKKGGIVSYKKGGLARYQGVEDSEVQVPMRPRGTILSPNTDPSLAMPMGNWELIGTDPNYGDVYQNERGEQIANIDGNWSHLMHGVEVTPPAARDYNQDAYNDQQDAAIQQQMMQNVFGDVNYQPPANNDIAYQTLEYKQPGTLGYYANNAANIFTNPGSALMYALDPREKNSSFDAYLESNNNPFATALDIAGTAKTGLLPYLGAEYLKYRINKEDPYNFEERAKDKDENVNLAGPGEGWKAAGGVGLTLAGAALATYLANKVGGKKAMLNYRKKLFPELYKTRLEDLYKLEKKFTPGQQRAIEQWEKYGEQNQRVGRFFKNKELQEAIKAGKTNAKNIWEYTYGNKKFPKYLADRFGPKAWINFLEQPYYSKNPIVQAAMITGELSAIPAAAYVYGETKPSFDFNEEEIRKGDNALNSNDWTTIEKAHQDSVAAWAKQTRGVENFNALPDSSKVKYNAEYLKELNNARTAINDSISTAADDVAGTVVPITTDSTKTNKKKEKKTEEKKAVKVSLPEKEKPTESPRDKMGHKLWGADWDTMSTDNQTKALQIAGYKFRDGGSLNRFAPGGGTDKFYYVTPENQQIISNKGYDLNYSPASTLQEVANYAGPQKGDYKMSPAGFWVPKNATSEEIANLDKETLGWIKNHEAFQDRWQNYNEGGYDQFEKDLAQFAKEKKENESWEEAEARFQKTYGRNPYEWSTKTFNKDYFFPKTGVNYFEYDDKGNIAKSWEIPGLQWRGLPKLTPKQIEEKKKEEEKKTVETKQEEETKIPPPNWQKAQRRGLPNARYADLMGEWGAAMQEIRRYPSMYAPINNAPIETIYDRFNPQTLMGAYTTNLQNAGTGPNSARPVDNVSGKVMEGVAQGQEQVQAQVNNPRFMNMVAQNQNAKMKADAYNAAEKIRFQDDVSTKWQDYLDNYNKKLANVTEKVANTAENRYKLGLLQSMYPYANLNFDEFTTANPTLNSITDEPVATSSNGSDNFSTLHQNAYNYYLSQNMSKAEAAKAAIEYVKTQMAYNKMYSGTAMSPFNIS